MNPEVLEKRKKLQAFSLLAKQKSEGTEFEGLKINDLIMKFIYNPSGNLIFETFRAWKEKGFSVKKGEKAFLLWGRPTADQEAEKNGIENDTDEKDKFFPLSYVFSSEQVEPLK